MGLNIPTKFLYWGIIINWGGDGQSRRKGKKLTENCMISEELRPVRDISWEVKKIFSKICILGGW